jgi:phosphoribosyl 1,2-cyclic phosphate phosphodiesterase
MNQDIWRATILGCGPSHGVPRIGPDWGACDPLEPKNWRLRCSLLVERFADGKRPTRILVDSGPDVREQLLSANVDHLDAVLYTHAHADHIHGIDDLRAFWLGTKKRLDIYADAHTMARLDEAFGYCFRTPPGSAYLPVLNPHDLRPGDPLTIEGSSGPITVTPFRQIHGDIDSLGFRFRDLAYSCDLNDLPPESLAAVADLDVWIIDALRYTHHPSHLNVEEALAMADRFRPRRTVFTHMHPDLDYATLKANLPPGIEPAYDGMQIAF